MSKSKSGQRGLSTPTYPTASPLLVRSNPLNIVNALSPVHYTQPYQEWIGSDRRLFRPDRSTAPPGSQRRSAVRLKPTTTPWGLRFSQPNLVSLCIRRKIRKQVLFALKRNKKGSGTKKRHRNFWSSISC